MALRLQDVTFPDRRICPALGPGTWRMGESQRERAAEVAAVRLALDIGCRVIDTAEMYGDGGAEGESLREHWTGSGGSAAQASSRAPLARKAIVRGAPAISAPATRSPAVMPLARAQAGQSQIWPPLATKLPIRSGRDSEPVMQQLLRYTQALFTHMAQTSACNRHHALDTQLCRWLLQHLDRQASDELQITQERIAGMLGVRREGITGAAMKLQRAGLINYGRGRIRVLDRR